MSARYETLRETFDQTVGEWLEDAIERVNPYDQTSAAQEAEEAEAAKRLLNAVSQDLKLGDLMAQAVMTLSNGQSRRARIAQALLKRPEVLIVDEPFMGLDPPNHRLLSELLDRISTPKEGGNGSAMPVVLGLRPQDPVPEWTTHLAYVEDDKVVSMGEKEQVVAEAKNRGRRILLHGEKADAEGVVEKVWAGFGGGEDQSAASTPEEQSTAESLVEMNDVRIAYYENVILDQFSWTIRRGERWGLFGPNGMSSATIWIG
jgi:ABC-type molybdenum transport system ATPase subunit/photorepair protein PhrA